MGGGGGRFHTIVATNCIVKFAYFFINPTNNGLISEEFWDIEVNHLQFNTHL